MYKTGPNNRGPDTSAYQSRRRKYHNKGMNRKSHLELLADESVVVTARRAVHTDRSRKAQGKLLVTDRRLIFQTNWLDSWFFSPLAVELSEIASVDVASRTYNVYDGGLARRLDIHLHDGTEHLFVLSSGEVDQYAARLETLVAQSNSERH